MSAYEPWRCKHDKPLDVLDLATESPRAEWCMECGCARRETLEHDGYAWGEWMRPAALARWPKPARECDCIPALGSFAGLPGCAKCK